MAQKALRTQNGELGKPPALLDDVGGDDQGTALEKTTVLSNGRSRVFFIMGFNTEVLVPWSNDSNDSNDSHGLDDLGYPDFFGNFQMKTID